MRENKLVIIYSILNNCMISSFMKIFVLIFVLYTFSQHYQGYLLTVVGLMGCIWVFEGFFYEYRLNKLEEQSSGDKK